MSKFKVEQKVLDELFGEVYIIQRIKENEYIIETKEGIRYFQLEENLEEIENNSKDIKDKLQEIKNIIMYLDENKSIDNWLDIQTEVNKQFIQLIKLKLENKKE